MIHHDKKAIENINFVKIIYRKQRLAMNIVTVIPARGGSKSIPRKNIIQLGGHPLIKYSIDYSIKCDLIARTIVSTDDEEIASISKLLGAEVPFIRPFNLAQDKTPDFPVLLHALHEI